jgi:hypothetical protein
MQNNVCAGLQGASPNNTHSLSLKLPVEWQKHFSGGKGGITESPPHKYWPPINTPVFMGGLHWTVTDNHNEGLQPQLNKITLSMNTLQSER